MEVDLSHGEYGEVDGRIFLTNLRQRVGALPGVTSTALASGIPLQGGSSFMGGLEPEGYQAGPDEWIRVGMNVVSPGYMELMEIPLLGGRDFLEQDVQGTEPVILVSRAFVDRYWSGQNGVGKLVSSGTDISYRVIGVVEDVPWRTLGEPPEPFAWFAFSQMYDQRMALHVKSSGDPTAILSTLREQLADLNPELPILRLDRLEALTDRATLGNRILSIALGIAGSVTLFLAMLGIYGVVAFSVSQRTRELGLRIALGADPRDVVRMVVKEGLGLALVGLVPGMVLSVVAAHLMRAVLMGMSPMDPVAFGGGTALLLVAVVAASMVPALRASRCDPMEALRED